MNGTCAPVRLVDRERRAELDRQGNGLRFTGIQFLGGIPDYAISVQGSPNIEERQSGDIDALSRREADGVSPDLRRLAFLQYGGQSVPSGRFFAADDAKKA